MSLTIYPLLFLLHVAGHDRPTTKTTYKNSPNQLCLRWDKADINSYYSYTGQQLQNTFLNWIMPCEITSPDIVNITKLSPF